MNNPDSLPIDVNEQREWLMGHKKTCQLSWNELAHQTGVKSGTLSQFGPGTYKGDNERVAREIFRFRQHLSTQAELDGEAPDVPGYFETATSRRILSLLAWAHRGRMTAVATTPGTGKSMTARHYRDSVSNVWLATMSPSSAKITNMMIKVLEAMGVPGQWGRSQYLSNRVLDRMRNTRGLLILDEAQHLREDTLEEIRSWYDETGVGIALLGNTKVIAQLEGGTRKTAFAQLYSRIGMRLVQNLPHPDDARALAAAWGIEDDRLIAFLGQKAITGGGLRTVTHMLELAVMIARAEAQPLTMQHLADAWTQLVSRPLAA